MNSTVQVKLSEVGRMLSSKKPFTSRPANTMLARWSTKSLWRGGSIWYVSLCSVSLTGPSLHFNPYLFFSLKNPNRHPYTLSSNPNFHHITSLLFQTSILFFSFSLPPSPSQQRALAYKILLFFLIWWTSTWTDWLTECDEFLLLGPKRDRSVKTSFKRTQEYCDSSWLFWGKREPVSSDLPPRFPLPFIFYDSVPIYPSSLLSLSLAISQ